MIFVKKRLTQYQRQGGEVEVKVIHNVKDHVAIINETLINHYDLIVINNRHNHFLDEWRPSCEAYLLRDCQQPVMIVGNKSWQAKGHILTAIETTESNQQHQ